MKNRFAIFFNITLLCKYFFRFIITIHTDQFSFSDISKFESTYMYIYNIIQIMAVVLCNLILDLYCNESFK